jgi:2-methylcitrate dehydratase
VADDIRDAIAGFAAGVSYENLSADAVRATLRHHLDAMGCALGGFRSQAGTVLRKLASETHGTRGASAYGVSSLTTVEMAAFANGSMVRHLDYNDAYPAKGGGHPSDFMPAIAAVAEGAGRTGADLVLGYHTAYEVFGALADAVPIRDKGWDQGAFVAVASAVGASVVLGLGEAQIAHAVSLALTPSLPLRVTRVGELSHWKGCATAHAAMNGALAARLAEEGLTGPPEPFTGVDAFCSLISGDFSLDRIGQPRDGLSAIERSHFKYFPTEQSSQGPVHILLKMRQSGLRADEMESISVRTFYESWHEIGGGQGDAAEKWDPGTRETADHSLPYIIAVALVDGEVTLDSFLPERVRDPDLRPIMQRVSVEEDPELSRRWPAEQITDVVARLRDGNVLSDRATYPRGHHKNPMTDDEVERKFRSMSCKLMADDVADSYLELLWNLDQQASLGELTARWRDLGR